MKTKRFTLAVALLLLSAVLLTTASFAWFSLNTTVKASGFQIEAYSDALFLQIGKEADGPFDITADLASEPEAQRRLVTLGHLTQGGLVIAPTLIEDGSRYDSTVVDPSVRYYQRVATDASRADTYEGENYICINNKLYDASSVAGYYNFTDGDISFSVVADARAVYDGTGTYYKKVGNTYYVMLEDAADEQASPYEIEKGDSVFGLYTVTFGTAQESDARYDGTSLYYARSTRGDLSPVGSLKLGSALDGYYTIEELSIASVADGEQKYYLKNSRNDYVCIGIPDKDADLTDYLFWARAYSGALDEVQSSNTLNVLKQDGIDNYYLHDTLYLRCAPDANPGEHLRVSSVTIDGNDSLTRALRVLFVATNGSGEVARATYNHRTGAIVHMDGEVLFDTILGDAQEVVTVEVYIYFDGTDEAAKTQNVTLSGQTVGVAFDIDRPDYVP